MKKAEGGGRNGRREKEYGGGAFVGPGENEGESLVTSTRISDGARLSGSPDSVREDINRG